MTKEQEEVIKLAKEFTKMDFSNPMDWTGYYDTELKELQEFKYAGRKRQRDRFL